MTKKNFRKGSRGFTLVEFAVICLISGLLMAAGLQVYRATSKGEDQDATYERLFATNNIIAQFQSLSSNPPKDTDRRYPCPADPTVSIDDAAYGLEVCPPDTATVGTCWKLNGGAVIAAPNGVCVRPGGVDSGLDADTDVDDVLIGAYPYKTVFEVFQAYIKEVLSDTDPLNDLSARNIKVESSAQSTMDGWSRKFTYVVSRSMVDSVTFEKRSGAIRVQDETTGAGTMSKDNVHYALVSHGENGIGAYTAFGILTKPCAGATKDVENCNSDGIVTRPLTRGYTQAAESVDDIIAFKVYVESEIWGSTGCPGSGSDEKACIYNKNFGNIGIDNTAPAEKLDISGNIRSDKSRSDKICDKDDPTICFEPQKIGGAGMHCPPAASPGAINVVISVHDNDVECTEVFPPTTFNPGTCAPGRFLVGFDQAGDIVCRTFVH